MVNYFSSKLQAGLWTSASDSSLAPIPLADFYGGEAGFYAAPLNPIRKLYVETMTAEVIDPGVRSYYTLAIRHHGTTAHYWLASHYKGYPDAMGDACKRLYFFARGRILKY